MFLEATISIDKHIVLAGGNDYDLDFGTQARFTIDASALSASDTLTLYGNPTVVYGGAGDDSITIESRGINSTTYYLESGGDDTIIGGLSDDIFIFGPSLTEADIVDGVGGYGDQIWLDGDYSGGLVLNFKNIASFTLAAGHSYDLTLGPDFTHTDSDTFNVQAADLGIGENLYFDGSVLGSLHSFRINSGAGNDILIGGSASYVHIFAGAGDDVVTGTGFLYGEDGNDTIYGGDGVNMLEGGAGDDVIVGGAFRNVVDGGDGNDTITAGGTANRLYGGSGDDTYIFLSLSADLRTSSVGDLIDVLDFGDQIDLSAIGSFSFIGATEFTGAAGQMKYDWLPGKTRIQLDEDGDGVADKFLDLGGQLDVAETFAESGIIVRVPDIRPPLLTETFPTSGENFIPVRGGVGFQFDEAIARGTGNIEFRTSDGSIVSSVSVDDTDLVRVTTGFQVWVNTGIILDPSTEYYVTLESGVIQDLAGNPYAGFLTSEVLNFTTAPLTDAVVPRFISSTAINGIDAGENIEFTYSEAISVGVGSIGLYRSGQLIETFELDDTSRVTISGNTVSVDPTFDLGYGVIHSIYVPQVRDFAGNVSPSEPWEVFTPGVGTFVDFGVDDPATYMDLIRDFDGNDLGGDNSWVLIGSADIQNDGDDEYILVNREIGRWATVGPAANGLVYFANHSWGGDTRVVGIYIDPEVLADPSKAGGPFDSQLRFQNDLFIENINSVLGADDYDGDGLQEIYFGLTDETAYLHAFMHADGNIQYANYQNEQQMIDYLTANGYTSATWDPWLYGAPGSSAGAEGTVVFSDPWNSQFGAFSGTLAGSA